MNKRQAEKMAREITRRVCMLGRFPSCDPEMAAMIGELANYGWSFLRERLAGFDGLTVIVDGRPAYYCAAPNKRNPGKKQSCTLYAIEDIRAYGDACDALASDDYAKAQRIVDTLESAALRASLADGLERAYCELGHSEVVAQVSAPVSDLDMVREVFGRYGLVVEQKRPGCCIFVSGDTKPHGEELKALGFRWAPKKAAWYWKPAA